MRHTRSNEDEVCVAEFTTECLLTAIEACRTSKHQEDREFAIRCKSELDRRIDGAKRQTQKEAA